MENLLVNSLPKSISKIFSSFCFFSRKFSGFKSLCTIPFSWQYFTACITCLNIYMAFSSSKYLCSMIRSKSSPPEQSSITRYTCWISSKIWNSLMIFWWSSFCNISTSILNLFLFLTLLFFIFFRA